MMLGKSSALAAILALASAIPSRAALQASASPTPVDTTQFQISDHLHGAPIPAGPDAWVEADFTRMHAQWLSRVLLAHYPADKDPQGAAFIKAALTPATPRGRLLAMERAIDPAKATDPGLLYMIGYEEPPFAAREHDAFARSLGLFPQSVYPKFLWFAAALAVDANAKTARGRERKSLDDTALNYLNLGLNDGSFQAPEQSILREFFDGGDFQGLFARREDAVDALFDNAADVQPWLRDYIRGSHFVRQAWKARTGNWGGNLTEDEIEGFNKGLSQARESLVKSWNENSHDPAAAAAMITVCMGEEEQTDTMRSWFDRSVSAQLDFMTAYSNLEWGLYPRWLGNYDEMNAFGEECAATGRYDTLVPYRRIQFALDISQDSHDHGRQFADPDTAAEVIKVINSYLAAPHPIINIRFAHTLAAIIEDKQGHAAEVRAHMAAIDYKPATNPILRPLANLQQLATQSQPASAHAPPPGAQDQTKPDGSVSPSASPDSSPSQDNPNPDASPG
jgi:hypothetical protein